MALPSYDKSKRKASFSYDILPKNAYVLKLMGAKEEPNKKGNGSHLTVYFDVAEGEYTDFYSKQYKEDPREDKKWPNDATYYLTVPDDNSQEFVWDNWNTFFADMEDSNGGDRIDLNNLNNLKGKLIGGKMHIEQSENNGGIYDHCRLRWTCTAEAVRQGKAGKLPNDKLIDTAKSRNAAPNDDEWVNVPDGVDDELPF